MKLKVIYSKEIEIGVISEDIYMCKLWVSECLKENKYSYLISRRVFKNGKIVKCDNKTLTCEDKIENLQRFENRFLQLYKICSIDFETGYIVNYEADMIKAEKEYKDWTETYGL